MPNHFHLILTPQVTLERSLQLIKGSYSYRATRELGFMGAIWQTSFHDRRVRDHEEYSRFREYIHQNPVKRGLALLLAEFPFSSAAPEAIMDPVPQRLKPDSFAAGMQG